MGDETNEETTERYAMEIRSNVVLVVDTKTGLMAAMSTAPNRLLWATERCAALNRQDALGIEAMPAAEPVTPRSFLAETLPAFVRNQRRTRFPSIKSGTPIHPEDLIPVRELPRPVWHEFVTPEVETVQPARVFWNGEEVPNVVEVKIIKPAPRVTRAQRLEAMLAEVKAQESVHLARLSEAARLLGQATSLRKRLETALSVTQSAEKAAGVGRDTESVLRPLRDAGATLSKPGPY